jgi:hypothetical protein
MPELTDERIRFVVREHQRLMRKLKRMPAANVMLAPDRLPDVSAGETIVDVVQRQIAADVRAVMDAIEALRPEFLRIHELYMSVVTMGAAEASRARDEVLAVARCMPEIERGDPRLKRLREAVAKRPR